MKSLIEEGYADKSTLQKTMESKKTVKVDIKKMTVHNVHNWILDKIKGEKQKILLLGENNALIAYILSNLGHKVTVMSEDEHHTNFMKEQDIQVSYINSSVLSCSSNKEYDVIVTIEYVERCSDASLVVSKINELLSKEGVYINVMSIEENILVKEMKYNFYSIMELYSTISTNYKICKLHKNEKYSRPKNRWGIVMRRDDKNE